MLLSRFCVVVLCTLIFTVAEAASDPTRPPFLSGVRANVAVESLKLSMILNDGQARRAVINESVVAVSDLVAGARVLAINEQSVELRRAGKTITLRMPMAGVRKDKTHE